MEGNRNTALPNKKGKKIEKNVCRAPRQVDHPTEDRHSPTKKEE